MLLLDTDILVLLTASNTLEQVTQHLGYETNQLRRLPAAPHQARKSKRFRDVYGEAVLQRILPAIEQIPEVTVPEDIDLLDSLNNVVDAGEAQLIAIAAANKYTLLASGDKRAIIDLAASSASECINNLQGRIVTLEAVLWILVQHTTARTVRQQFEPVLTHKTLSVVLSTHTVAEGQRCLDAIQSYYDNLAQSAGALLYNPAPKILGTWHDRPQTP